MGAIAVVFNWNRADTEAFAKLVGGMGLSAAFNANPLLLVVTAVALARAFQKARQTGAYAEFADGLLKGGIGAGTTLTAVATVGVAGGKSYAQIAEARGTKTVTVRNSIYRTQDKLGVATK